MVLKIYKKILLTIFLSSILFLYGCAGLLDDVSINDLNTNPKNYTHGEYTISGTLKEEINSMTYEHVNWALQDEQGYLIRLKCDEAGRILTKDEKYTATGNLIIITETSKYISFEEKKDVNYFNCTQPLIKG